MELVKRPNTTLSNLLSDFFDTERFFKTPALNGDSFAPVNIREHDKNFEIELAAPGFKKDDIKIDLEENVLTISGERKEEKSQSDENYTRQEFSYNSFCRSFSLPENSNAEKIEGQYTNGIVRLTLPKKTNGKTTAKKQIKLQ